MRSHLHSPHLHVVNDQTKTHAQGDELAPGSVVKGYTIEKQLRKGRSSIVYTGHSVSGEKVAIKEYFPKSVVQRLPSGRVRVTDEHESARFSAGSSAFLREGVTIASIRCDLLVQQMGVFRENGTAYLVTRYESGDTLEEFTRKHHDAKSNVHEDDVRFIYYTLLNAVGEMHKRGFVHLDIKPSNVIMRDANTPILIDLGAARPYPDTSGMGYYIANYTPGFAAPEQYEDTPSNLGPWTDIYGIGASIYYCISKMTPQPADLRLKGDELAPAAVAFKGRYSRQLLEAVDKCMALDMKDRYPDVKPLQLILCSR